MKIIIMTLILIGNSCIKNTSKLNKVNKDIDDDLVNAAIKGKKIDVANLLKRGADVNHKNNLGNTALMVACRSNYIDLAKLLLEKGAYINEHTKHFNALTIAAINGYEELVKLLIEKGADVNHKNTLSNTALMYSSNKIKEVKIEKRDNYINIARVLIKRIRDNYINLFISLNKAENKEHHALIIHEIKNCIDLFHNILLLPTELFFYIISFIDLH